MRKTFVSILLLFTPVQCFMVPSSEISSKSKFGKAANSFKQFSLQASKDPLCTNNKDVNKELFSPERLASSLVTSAILFTPTVSSAAGPDWGLFEGRTGSLLHPVTMFVLLAMSVNAAVLGLKWKRQRTIGDDISALKKTMPKYEGTSLSEAIAKAESDEDNALASLLKGAKPIEEEIGALTAERKQLSSEGNREKHFNQGSALAFVGTLFAIIGPLNTYSRAGKLFPGPHLYAGAGLVCLWALAVACVPYMQRGNDTARNVHIAANFGGIGLFGWQVVSGVPILLKVLEKTQWP